LPAKLEILSGSRIAASRALCWREAASVVRDRCPPSDERYLCTAWVRKWPDPEARTAGAAGPPTEVGLPRRRSEWHGSFWPMRPWFDRCVPTACGRLFQQHRPGADANRAAGPDRNSACSRLPLRAPAYWLAPRSATRARLGEQTLEGGRENLTRFTRRHVAQQLSFDVVAMK